MNNVTASIALAAIYCPICHNVNHEDLVHNVTDKGRYILHCCHCLRPFYYTVNICTVIETGENGENKIVQAD